MKLSPAQFEALTAYVEAIAAKAAMDACPNHDDDCYGVGESLALHYAREAAEKALVDPAQ